MVIGDFCPTEIQKLSVIQMFAKAFFFSSQLILSLSIYFVDINVVIYGFFFRTGNKKKEIN